MPGNGPALTPPLETSDRRLGSWKEIAAYLGRGVRSAQRWEREEGLPVHRLSHQKRGSVYAYKSELDAWWENRRSSLITELAEISETALQNASETRLRTTLSAKSAILAAIVVLAAVVLYFTNRHARETTSEMRQLTRIGSVRPLGCSLSGDGKLIVFASDAAEEGNVDIWIQETGGSQARRLTHGPEPDTDPSISPDGANVLFVSRRTSVSGIYRIPAAGGQETLLILEGEEPRYSPDGKQIAYVSGKEPRRLFVSDSDGAHEREIPTPLVRSDHPIWSPDGKHLMIRGQRAFGQPADWWVIPTDGDGPIDSEVLHDLRPYVSSSLRASFYAQAWLPGERSCSLATRTAFGQSGGDGFRLALFALSARPNRSGTGRQLVFTSPWRAIAWRS